MCAGPAVFVCPMVGAHLVLLGVVSKWEETGKEPGISKENRCLQLVQLVVDSKVIRRGESSVSYTSLLRENRQKPKHERMVGASN